jgi:hypothetical protein
MKIDTENYRDEHGKSPKGHGAWAFLIGRRPGEFTQVTHSGTYAEACRFARSEAKMIGGSSSITLLP